MKGLPFRSYSLGPRSRLQLEAVAFGTRTSFLLLRGCADRGGYWARLTSLVQPSRPRVLYRDRVDYARLSAGLGGGESSIQGWYLSVFCAGGHFWAFDLPSFLILLCGFIVTG